MDRHKLEGDFFLVYGEDREELRNGGWPKVRAKILSYGELILPLEGGSW